MKKDRPIRRLIECIQFLGWSIGWKYWRMQNLCIKKPQLSLEIAAAALEGAVDCAKHGDHRMASALEEWSKLLRHRHKIYMAEFHIS